MAHTDMAIGVHHVFVGENAVGDHQIVQKIVEIRFGMNALR